MSPFQFIVLTPPGMRDPSIAIAACRAGALGVIDLEFIHADEVAFSLVKKMVRHAQNSCGVRIGGVTQKFLKRLTADFSESVGVVILTSNDPQTLKRQVAALHQKKIQVLYEATSIELALAAVQAGVDGLIAKGNEAGGWVGEETTFVLLQRLLKSISLPVWAQGGIGLHSVAACYTAGAAGVVLDAQMALTRESQLPMGAKDSISRMDGSETICLGEKIGAACRIFFRPRLPIIEKFQDLEKTLLANSKTKSQALKAWTQKIRKSVDWANPEKYLWLLGQDAAFAAGLGQRFGTVAGILDAMRQAIDEHMRSARSLLPLNEKSALARSHGTRYPIVQGPMTRVSDRASFAVKVAEAGGLPFLALAMLPAPEVETLLKETSAAIGKRAWGVGILGFVPLELREEQLEVIRAFRPPFALVAGGRPDQAMALEQDGISTYLHVPSPELLRMFIRDGARRFVFEGRECGGHVGPRSSFVLWNCMCDILLEELSEDAAEECHILFAGGIHDELSSAMVATIAAPLARRGMKIGTLLGTSYLFTVEAVSSGAITRGFQKEAIRCRQTVLLESGPGHAVRSATTPYADMFLREKLRLTKKGKSAEEIRNELETLNLGRLRIASKGIERNPQYGKASRAAKFKKVAQKDQQSKGLYMIGQNAALRDRTCTMEDLHRDVSLGGSQRLEDLQEPGLSKISVRQPQRACDVAIIGMACLMPKASDVQTYWENILNQVDAITEVPKDRWDHRLYYDPDPKARDRVYSKWGGFLDAIPFDPMRYGMPPNSLSSIEPLHLLTLETVRAALADAGYLERPFMRDRTSVLIGAGGGVPDLGELYSFRARFPQFSQNVPGDVLSQLPEWTEDSFPGILNNVAAGRVANRFDLGGANFTVDAACASSLAAIYSAVRELESGDSDMVIAGGADTAQSPFAYLCFSKTMALSPQGRCRTFDQSADGTSIGEGVAMLILKRLADAERDGDRIYAVIKAVGASSDGRAKGLTAPHPAGQVRALRRAYAKAGFSPATVRLIEAHGTGTVAGDRAEIETLRQVFEEDDSFVQNCAIGSVKSMIGHTKCASGVAGLIKVALALYHKVLPSTLGVENPNPSLAGSPFYVNTETRPWIQGAGDYPRRAGISGFGFGGTNFHCVLEEYTGNYLESDQAMLSRQWPSELLLWTGRSRDELVTAVAPVANALEKGATPPLRDLAFTLWHKSKVGSNGCTLAVVAQSPEDLQHKLVKVRKALSRSESAAIHDPAGIYFVEQPLIQGKREGRAGQDTQSGRPAKVAFLFSGQGSQYPDMLKDLALHFPEVSQSFDLADRILTDQYPRPLSSYIFPPSSFSASEEATHRDNLTQTNIAQPSVGAAAMGLFRLLGVLGVRPDMVAGHSYGEYAALCAAGVFPESELYVISEARGRMMLAAAKEDLGTMAAVKSGRKPVAEALQSFENVWVANLNSPAQTIISGTHRGVEKAIKILQEKGMSTRPITVSCAFHSPLMKPVQKRFAEFLATLDFKPPTLEVFSNTYAAPYPCETEAIRSLLIEHLTRPVEFAGEIESMYRAGARIFIELGPRNVLANLTRDILDDRPHLALALDNAGRSGLTQLQHALGQLAVNGIPANLDRLYEGRQAQLLNLDTLATESDTPLFGPAVWMVNGGRSWPFEKAGDSGPLSDLSKEEKASLAPGPQPPTSSTLQFVDELSGRQPDAPAANGADPLAPGNPIVSDAPITQGEADAIMVRHQRLMQQFLASQHRVMMAYLTGEAKIDLSTSVAFPSPEAHLGETKTAAMLDNTEALPPEPEPVSASAEDRTPVDPQISTDQISAHLLKLVSDRTGYPSEMLDLDLDLEADLGIDSIKRVEILGALQKDYVALEQQAQAAMEELTKIKTLRGIIDWVSQAVESDASGHSPAMDPRKEKAPIDRKAEDQAPVEAQISTEQVSAHLIKIVSDRTGYPSEMLDLDLDLEADLGIDSIKRVEILGALQKDYVALEQQAQVAMEELTKIKTLRGIIDWISQATKDDASQQSPGMVVKKAPDDVKLGADKGDKRNEPLSRFVLGMADAHLSEQRLHLDSDSVFLITDDERGIARAMADKIRSCGGLAVLVRARKKAGKASKRIYTADLTDPEAAVELLKDIHHDFGPVGGVIHLLPLKARKSFKQMSFKDWRNRLRMETKSLFYLAKAVSQDLQQRAANGTGFFFAATGMGGNFGIGTEALKSFFPNHGGITGLVKTLALEWENVKCKVVDCDSAASASTAADQLLAEMADKNGEVEVGYRDSSRVIPQLAAAQIDEGSSTGVSVDSSWVLLVTGGARGITAEATLELAERYQPTILLVGRTPLPETDESPKTIGITSAHELKAALIEAMRASGQEFTLAQVETRYQQLCREREIRKNIAAMQAAGATVKYHAVDVCDEQAFGDLFEEIYRSYGRLDGIIHAAGIIEDKLTVDKLPESFDRVFDTKVDSAFVLAKKVRADALRFLVFFSSVAGRFGNRGQCDYVAANEVLNKLAVYLDRQWPGRVVAINWGPWAKAGMVTDEVEKQFAQRGVGLVAPAAGRLSFEKELRLAPKGAVEVTIGQVQAESHQAMSLSAGPATLPLIAEGSFSISNADHFEFDRTLDVKHDLFLKDHQLDGNPVLPMAMALEMMAEVVQQGLPELKIVKIQSLQVLKGIVLNNKNCRIRISARPRATTSHAADIMEVDTEIAELERPDQPCYRAVVHAGKQSLQPTGYDHGKLSELRPFPMPVDKAYERWLFQGSYFQGISVIDGLNDHGICGLLAPSSPPRAFAKGGKGQWLIDPVVLDSSLQLAILWERAFFDMTPLPARFACYHRFDSPPAGPVYCYVHTKPSLEGHILIADFYYVDDSGRVIGILEQMESSCTKDFNRLAEFSKSSKGGN